MGGGTGTGTGVVDNCAICDGFRQYDSNHVKLVSYNITGAIIVEESFPICDRCALNSRTRLSKANHEQPPTPDTGHLGTGGLPATE